MSKRLKVLSTLPVLAALALTLLPSCGPAVPLVTAEVLKQQIDAGDMVSIVDVRRKDDYDVDHIKGALNMQTTTITSGSWQPPKNSGWVFAFYCS